MVQEHKTGKGWIIFSGVMMLLAGLNILFIGIVALDASQSVENRFRDRVLFADENIDVWGWIYLIVGVIVILAAIAVFRRAQWARWLGIIGAAIGMFTSFFWLFGPYWQSALVSVALYGMVLYGLGVYGEPLET
jgi:uncharacterized membrane protein HdeD (DUF308 family)